MTFQFLVASELKSDKIGKAFEQRVGSRAEIECQRGAVSTLFCERHRVTSKNKCPYTGRTDLEGPRSSPKAGG